MFSITYSTRRQIPAFKFFFNVLNIYYFKPRLLSFSIYFFRTPQFFQAYFMGSLMLLSRIWAPSILWPRIGFDTGPF